VLPIVHELALMSDLVDTVIERFGDKRVHVVRLVVGARSGVAADALRFSFDVATQGTAIEGAVLELRETPGKELELQELEVSECV
jgi:hydrogenase nickel incorporation protein HypA/HybF